MIRKADAKWRGNSKCFLIFCLQSSSDEDIRISDSEEEQDDPESSGSFETVERRIVYSPKKKVQSEEPKPKTFYMGIQEAEIFSNPRSISTSTEIRRYLQKSGTVHLDAIATVAKLNQDM